MPNSNQTNSVTAWYEAAKKDCIRPFLSNPSLFSDIQSYLALFDDKKNFQEVKNLPPGLQRINEVCKNNLLGLTDNQKIAFFEAARSIYLYDELPNEVYFNAKDYAYRIIQKIINELLADSHWLKAKTACKAPYRDLIWLSSPSELMLKDIDTFCMQAINQLCEEEKKDFCSEAEYVIRDNEESYLQPYLKHAHRVIVDTSCKKNTDASKAGMSANYTEESNAVLERVGLSNVAREVNNATPVTSAPLGSESYASKLISETEFMGIDSHKGLTQSSTALILGASLATVGLGALFSVGFWAIKKFKCFSNSDQNNIQNDEMFSLKSRQINV